MRWLNLKLVDLLMFGLYEKLFKKKAAKAYLGFLDSQIMWNAAAKDIPKGFDTKRNFVYFSARVPFIETAIVNTIYLVPLLIFPWPSLFAKHRLVRYLCVCVCECVARLHSASPLVHLHTVSVVFSL